MNMTNRRRTITLPDEEAKRQLGQRSRRDFLIGGLAAAGAIGAYEWITKEKEDDGVPWPQRRVLRPTHHKSKQSSLQRRASLAPARTIL